MESFVFNSFKERLMRGDVKLSDVWYHYPVNKKFAEAYENDIKSLSSTSAFIMYDMANNNASYYKATTDNNKLFTDWYNYYGTQINKVTYTYKPMDEEDLAMKPEFVTKDGWDSFSDKDKCPYLYNFFFYDTTSIFYRETNLTDTEGHKKPRGFYYVKTKEELLWCAQKVNGSSYDNEINIVLGDNIGYESNYSNIKTPIGVNPSQPFNGILFGNGFGFMKIRMQCENDVNGIVGYLGKNGIIDHLWVKDCMMVCKKNISLTHLTTGSFDVVAGFVCGKNNGGRIQYVYVADKMVVNNFVPKMYSVANKTDINTDSEALTNPAGNVFYPDYLCYNSVGNIIPYVGYFNEGVFATYSGWSKATETMYTYWNTKGMYDGYIVKENKGNTSPKEWYYWNGVEYKNETDNVGGYLFSYTAPANRKNILWYDSTMIEESFRMYDEADMNSVGIGKNGKDFGLVLLKQNAGYSQEYQDIEYAPYFNQSIKMNQQNRAAYYVSPVVGVNGGILNHVYVSADMQFSGTFVGFAGGLAGKQANGYIANCKVNLSASDVVSGGEPVRDYLISTDNYDNQAYNYCFEKRSIKNIGGLFGSIIVGNNRSLQLESVDSYFSNMMNVISDNGNTVYKDYYFDNRFAGLAAMVEYNSSNIGDIWFYNSRIAAKYKAGEFSKYAPGIDPNTMYLCDINDSTGHYRSIQVSNCDIRYAENKDTRITKYTPLRIVDICNSDLNYNYQYGVSSPIFGEIKPIYLSVPSIITTPFHNTSKQYADDSSVFSDIDTIGVIGMDQQIACPRSNPNYWAINTEVDLPGISNGVGLWVTDANKGVVGWKADGYAGGVIDCLNTTSGANFDMDIKSIAKMLVHWDNTLIGSNVYSDYFKCISVPYAATISESNVEEIYMDERNALTTSNTVTNEETFGNQFSVNANDDTEGITLKTGYRRMMNGMTRQTGYRAIPGSYNGNKKLTRYPYFGSDLSIIPTETDGHSHRDTLNLTHEDFDYDFVEIIYTDAPYYCDYPSGQDARCGVKDVRIRIKKEAFNYAPFTDKVFSSITEANNYYVVHARADRDDIPRIGREWTASKNWTDGSPATGGACKFVDFYESDDQASFNEWMNTNAFGAKYGWYFYTDYDTRDPSETISIFLQAFISFDMSPYSRRKESGVSPPFFPFTIGYIAGESDGSTDDYDEGAKDFNSRCRAYCCKPLPLSKITSVKFYKGDINAESGLTEVVVDRTLYSKIHPEWYTELQNTGLFCNSLVQSYGGNVNGVTQNKGAEPVNYPSSAWYGYMSADSNFVNIATNAFVDSGNLYSTYFKYTYTRNIENTNNISGAGDYEWFVGYEYQNGRAGFWCHNDNAKYSSSAYNDKIVYTPNYMTFGKTLSEACILEYLNRNETNRKNGCKVVGFSADDFDGIYVTDSDRNPVMYIDVGMGECSPGTSWSYECYPSTTEKSDRMSGLLLETNRDDIIDNTEEDENA
jgi:hypothetical protein